MIYGRHGNTGTLKILQVFLRLTFRLWPSRLLTGGRWSQFFFVSGMAVPAGKVWEFRAKSCVFFILENLRRQFRSTELIKQDMAGMAHEWVWLRQMPQVADWKSTHYQLPSGSEKEEWTGYSSPPFFSPSHLSFQIKGGGVEPQHQRKWLVHCLYNKELLQQASNSMCNAGCLSKWTFTSQHSFKYEYNQCCKESCRAWLESRVLKPKGLLTASQDSHQKQVITETLYCWTGQTYYFS